jgi:hypothetical protein
LKGGFIRNGKMHRKNFTSKINPEGIAEDGQSRSSANYGILRGIYGGLGMQSFITKLTAPPRKTIISWIKICWIYTTK